jgi:hypothetical protein
LLKAAFQNNFTVPLEGELENLGHLLSSKDSIVALALDRRQDRQNPKIVGITVAEMGRVPVRLKEGLRTLKLCELTDGAVSPELQRKGLLSALSYELLKRVAIEEPHAVFGEARALNPGVLKALFRMGFVSGRTAVGTSLVSGTTGGTSLLPQHVRIGGVRDKKMLANLPDAWRFNFGKHEPLAVVYLPPERLKNIQLS